MSTTISTGRLARLFGVAPRTVSKWIDSGRLVGFRIPFSRHRKVLLETAIKFAEEHGLPVSQLKELLPPVAGDAPADVPAAPAVAIT